MMERDSPGGEGYRLILAAVSERREGLYTVELAARIAARTGARLVIYHSIDVASIPLPPDDPVFREVLSRLRARARSLLEAAAAIAESMGARRVETVKLEGDPVEGLWEVIRRIGTPDLIVVGYPSRRPLGPLGSGVHRIIRGAPASVLIAAPQARAP